MTVLMANELYTLRCLILLCDFCPERRWRGSLLLGLQFSDPILQKSHPGGAFVILLPGMSSVWLK